MRFCNKVVGIEHPSPTSFGGKVEYIETKKNAILTFVRQRLFGRCGQDPGLSSLSWNPPKSMATTIKVYRLDEAATMHQGSHEYPDKLAEDDEEMVGELVANSTSDKGWITALSLDVFEQETEGGQSYTHSCSR